jgi:hypothetical protein
MPPRKALDMESVMHTSDVTIHISQALTPVQQQEVESAMREIDGVIAPRFNLPHMLVVLYNTDKTSSAALLAAVSAKGHQARLVGL